MLLAHEHPEDWIVLVPSPSLIGVLRSALADVHRTRAGHKAALLLPRILVLSEWARNAAGVLGRPRSPTRRRIELFNALGATDGLARQLGASGAQLWSLARQLLSLCDELTYALGSLEQERDVPAIEARILAVLKGSYTKHAWQMCSEEAELVLGVWRSTLSSEDGAALALRGLEQLLRTASAPLCVIAPLGLESFSGNFLARYAHRAPVEIIDIDLALTFKDVPALKEAWPEILLSRRADEKGSGERCESEAPSTRGGASDAVSEPLLTRARRLSEAGAPLLHSAFRSLDSLEEEAVCAAETIIGWLAEGRRRVALVALDRLTARRVRALLERADVLVCDEAGWKLSTATVAGSLMRWLEIVHVEESKMPASVLLDWLKSPHALPGQVDKAELVAALEIAIRRHNVVRGWSRIDLALERESTRIRAQGDARAARALGNGEDPAALQAARVLVASLRALARPTAGSCSLSEHFDWLRAQLEATGMGTSFSSDPVGIALLDEIRSVSQDASGLGSAGVFSFSQWRDFVADVLENATFRERTIESPVVSTSLAEAAFRPFDAVLVLGANAEHFPGDFAEGLFFNRSVRKQLGLRDPAAAEHRALCELALLMAASPRVAVTWRSSRSDPSKRPAAALERLTMLYRAAFGKSLVVPWSWQVQSIRLHRTLRPAPGASALVPKRLSASGYNLLLSCPYRYFVRYMLEIAPFEELREDAEKRDYGELVHRTLERFHGLRPQVGERALALSLLAQVSDEVFGRAAHDNAAFLGYAERWHQLMESYIDWWAKWEQQGWQFERSEVFLERHLPLGAGASLVLNGRLDRIDRSAKGLAIIDYKARAKKALQDGLKEPGEDVQLPFYRLLLADEGDVCAGYLSVDREKVEMIDIPHGLDGLAKAVARRITDDFQRLSTGAAMPAHGAESACAHCDARGLCRKGQWNDPPT